MSSSWSVEVETRVPAIDLFRVGFIDWHNLAPKLVPDIITGVTILSGDGGSGTIRHVDLTSAVPFSFMKELFEFVDHEKLEVKIKILEGGNLGQKFESLSNYFKVEPKGKGSIIKLEETYQVIPGVDIVEDLQKSKEAFIRSVKAAEEYLLANPNN